MEPAQYVVTMKMVHPGEDGDKEVVSCPRLRVAGGQPATVKLLHAVTPEQESGIEFNVAVRKEGAGVALDVMAEDSCIIKGQDSGSHAQRETARLETNVPLGQACKLELKHDADGTLRSWVEVTVTEGEREARTAGACPASQACDDEDSPIISLVQCINDIMCSVADTASDLFGTDTWSDSVATPAEYLQQPPQYYPAAPACPMAREVAGQQASCPTTCASCTACTRRADGACTQCSATEEAKPASVHIGIDTLHHRMVVEMCDGKKRFTVSADRITVHDGSLQLEGNIRGESPDGSAAFTADKMTLKIEGVDIHIGE